jgi:hypothetical protein
MMDMLAYQALELVQLIYSAAANALAKSAGLELKLYTKTGLGDNKQQPFAKSFQIR